MRARQPGLSEHRRLARAPEGQESREARRKQRREGFRRDSSAKVGGLAVGQRGPLGQVHSEPRRDPVAAALEQDAGELLALRHQVVGPFEHERLPGHGRVDGFDQRQTRRKRKALRRTIAGREIDDRAAVEIARRRYPGAALPPPARPLFERDEPIAFMKAPVG
jgi:hypothetical protein